MNQHRSIFHLGEEGGDDGHHRGVDHHGRNSTIDIHRHLGEQNHGRRQRRGQDAGADVFVVGLQILVQHQHQHQHQHRHHPQPCRVVLKQMIFPPAAGHCFLRACSLCRRELSSNKEVYMYRGDQGFCSEECRRRQILADQAREREAMVVNRMPHHRRHHGQRRLPPAIGGAQRRLLAVA